MGEVTGIAGAGTVLRRWNASATPAKYEAIGNITDISGPSPKVDTKDTTDLSNTESKTFIAGLIDEGEVKLSMKFARADYDIMNNDLRGRALQNYEVVLPDADNTTFEFEALVTGIDMKVASDLITADVTLKISGSPTINSGSGPSPG